jgi:ABC-type transport system involved in multi-copper enzyme maturation permease subunit
LRIDRPFLALFRLEVRHLLLGRAWICLAIILSLLVGSGFHQALTLFSDASRSAAGAGDLAQGLNPFDGILVPTFGALYLVATLLLPFVALRQVGLDQENGAWKLLLRSGFSVIDVLAAKGLVLVLFWLAMMGIPLVAVALWTFMGGHIHGPELAGLLLGHALYGMAVLAVAFLAASLARNSATASLLTLAATLGSWVLDFNAGMGSAWMKRMGALSLTSALRPMERGLLEAGHLAAWLVGLGMLLALAAVLLKSGRSLVHRLIPCAAIVLGSIPVLLALGSLRASKDLSEDRRHSFPPGIERALGALRDPLGIEVHLDPEDPRWQDLNRQLVGKLRRVVPRVDVQLGDAGSGRYGVATGERYGEVIYSYQGRQEMSRSTSPEEVLQVLWSVTRTTAPPEEPELAYPGYPLIPQSRWSGPTFMFVIPSVLILLWLVQWLRVPHFQRRSS